MSTTALATTANPWHQVAEQGQSVWLDFVRRNLLKSGELARMMDEEAISGVTANPTIFEKAITGSTDYDDAIRQLVDEGADANQIYEELATDDVRMAADILSRIWEAQGGRDGYVSIEVSPRLAHDTAGSVEEARDFWNRVDRPNLLIKIPATAAGLPAIRQLIGEGINVNITLIFARSRHREVMEAYLAGLEDLLAAKTKPLEAMHSVASFFVSRVDTLVDSKLDKLAEAAGSEGERNRILGMRGKAGIANARLAYQDFLEVFGGERFKALSEKGARLQRPLWASTGVKDPAYKDTLYCEELIGPDSVNTVPPATLNAFREHGIVRGDTILESVDYSRRVEQQLKDLGIDLEEVGRELEADGVKKFDESFDNLLGGIEEKRQRILHEESSPYSARLGSYEGAVQSVLDDLHKKDISRKLDQRDPSAWSDDPETQREIRDRLGWLTVVDQMEDEGPKLKAFAERVRDEGFRDVVLLGMGGSSLAPEVLKQTFGSTDGFPKLHVLDTTDPDAIKRVEQSIDIGQAVFIISSKSGGTIETATLGDYFWERCGKNGRQFVAITDPGTDLAQQASDRGYRQTFTNPPDIGGRYSALSYFGLVPAALIGVDVSRLIASAQQMEHACDHCVADMENPGVWLGGVIGALAREGRDKLTFVLSPEVGSFGLWVEQLIAESTGKNGRGIVPVADEALGTPDVYGDDRVFVEIRVGSGNQERSQQLDALAAAGHPLISIQLRDAYDIGGQFMLWEVATAIAGSVLDINPFDQPNVQESKDNTKRILDELAEAGRLPSAGEPRASNGIAVIADRGASAREALAQTLKDAGPGGYVALMAYLPEDDKHQEQIDRLRTTIRDRLRVATTFGYGPRFLHSTGQLHKGGAQVGTFIQITGEPASDVQIPGRSFSFAQLEAAQALGDLQALQSRNRPVARINVGRDTLSGLEEAVSVVQAALSAEG